MLWNKLSGATLLALSALQCVSGHMQLFSPIPRGDPRNKGYGQVAPHPDGALFGGGAPGKYPCRFQKEGPVTARYTAGQDFIVEFMQGSPHMGGHCQFAFSYDNGKTWVVTRTIIDMCFMGIAPYRYTVPIPKGARNGKALFTWTFINAGGNSEYYMNCADIEITGGSPTGSLTGPELMLARTSGAPEFPRWANKDASQDGKENFNKRKIVTIPAGSTATTEGTVVGEAGGGKPGAVKPPTKIPWSKFIASKFADNNGARKKKRTDLGPTGKDMPGFFIATSADPRGGTGGKYNDKKLTPTTADGKDTFEPTKPDAGADNDTTTGGDVDSDTQPEKTPTRSDKKAENETDTSDDTTNNEAEPEPKSKSKTDKKSHKKNKKGKSKSKKDEN